MNLNGFQRTESIIDLPAIAIEADQSTRFIPRKAQLNGGIKIYMPDEPFKSFWLENWFSPSQSIQWNVDAKKSDYVVEVLISPVNLNKDEEITLELSDGSTSVQRVISGEGWQRCVFDSPIKLSTGVSTLTLRMLSSGTSTDFGIRLYSLELTPKALYAQLKKRAEELRSNAQWMGDLKYGFFFHWNANSMPRHGEPKSYEEAVRDFDVDAFAKTVDEAGGELVIFTTSWANANFPAPLKAFDDVLPGRTTGRDLVTDLSNALAKYGIKLILYYNIKGDDHWLQAQSYSRDTPQVLFANLEKILGEISDRYGDKIAGLWLDDGMGYYPNGANFERITRTAKRSNKDLLVCYNAWIFPRLTDFQDYYGGELGLSEKSAGVGNPYLPIGGNGVFVGGPQDGLQATYCGLLESGDWTHTNKNSEINDPNFTVDQLTKIIEESNERKNLPVINVGIYQDGTISPQTYELLKGVKLRFGNPGAERPENIM